MVDGIVVLMVILRMDWDDCAGDNKRYCVMHGDRLHTVDGVCVKKKNAMLIMGYDDDDDACWVVLIM